VALPEQIQHLSSAILFSRLLICRKAARFDFLTFKLVREMKKSLFYLVLFLGFQLVSCTKDMPPAPVESVKYEEGIFIVNEGPFQQGTGTLTFYDRTNQNVIQEVFTRANDGESLGNVFQSMNIIDGKAYLVINNSGKVVVADGLTFEKLGEITGLAQPRYVMDLGDGRIAISQWGADGLSGSVSIYNSSDMSLVTNIPTGAGAEGMLVKDGKLYVANSGGYGVDSTVAIIDLATNSLQEKLPSGVNPSSMVVDKNGALWVLCSGYSNWNDPNDPLNAPGKLVRYANDLIALALDVPTYSSDLAVSTNGEILYALINSEPYGMHIDSTALPSEAITHGQQSGIFYYSLGLDPVTGHLLLGNAEDYISPGEVDVFQDDGVKVMSIAAGLIPGGYFAR